jgi:type VI secretion system protein ImpB
LMLYMDGKDGAQGLLDKVLKDPDLMKALAAARSEEKPDAGDAQ